MASPRRLAAALVSVGLIAGGLAIVGVGPASAASSTVTVPYRCVTTLFGVGYDNLDTLDVTLTAPAAVNQGDPIPVTYDLVDTPTNVPIALTNVVYNASASVSGQPQFGGTVVTGTGSGADSPPADVAAFAPLPISVSQSVPLPTVGYEVGDDIQLRPAQLSIAIVSGDGGIGGGVINCTPEPSAPVALVVFLDGVIDPDPDDQCTAQLGDTTGGPGCDTQQNVFSTILPGNLTQVATVTAPNPNSTTIDLGDTTSSTTVQTLTAPLNTVTVTDNRGGSFQWSLTATLTDFEDGTNVIAASQASISPSCSSVASGSAPGAVAGAPGQSFGGAPVGLCVGPSVPDLNTGTTGGQWAIDGPVSLDVPPFQATGEYVAIMTINLA